MFDVIGFHAYPLLFAVLLTAPAPAMTDVDNPVEARLGTPAEIEWLEVDMSRRELRVSEGTTVEVRGSGSLQFRNGRRVIEFPESLIVLIDGAEVAGSGTAEAGAEVVLISESGEIRWTLRQAFSIPREEGTTISDDDPEATAAIETIEQIQFFLRVGTDGVTTFFHPTDQDVSRAEPRRPDPWPPARAARHVAVRSELDTYFARLAQFGFSGTVSFAEGDDLVFADAYGLADREDRRPFLPSTILTIGSITKSFTAAAVLKLQDMGLLAVADAITVYLDDVPADKQEITLHQLLTHTSGLKRNGLEGGDLNLEATRDAVLRDVLRSELLSPPGAAYSYSNVGYSLLAVIVENALGLSYEEFVYRYLLVPSGMFRTGYLLPSYRSEELAAGYLDGERLDPVIRLPMLADGPTWNLRGNGGLHSDSYDMFRWFVALRSYKVLSTDALNAMTEAHVDQGDGNLFYGYGLDVGRTSVGTRELSHRGGNGYFSAAFHWLPDEDYMFFIGSNAASQVNMTRLSGTVKSILLGEPYALPPLLASVPAATLREYEGSYLFLEGDSVVVTHVDGALVLRGSGDYGIQAVLGGTRTLADAQVEGLAQRSLALLEAEFRGDFEPKYEAMGGTTSILDLERYHQYDRENWDDQFGPLERIDIAAAAGEADEVEIVVRLNFMRGAGAQIHTWREERLANISVIPDWREFDFSRTVFPISDTEFESFTTGSAIRAMIRIEREDQALDAARSIVFPLHPDTPRAQPASGG
ncbi:MAG: serine hydrolase domain-containing protein [Gemmatimonadota bacterium]